MADKVHGLGLGVDIPRTTPRVPSSSASAVRTNPISLRLWKVISSSSNGGFDDPSSHEALEIISERYCGPKATTSTGESSNRKRQRTRKARDVGAHWLGADAVRRAGLARDDSGNGAHRDTDETYWSSSSDSESSGGESIVSDLSIAGPPTRPGILARNHSSTTSIRSTTYPDGASHAASASLALGATNARKYFKRDLEAGLVEGSMKFLKAFEKVDDVSLEVTASAAAGSHSPPLLPPLATASAPDAHAGDAGPL